MTQIALRKLIGSREKENQINEDSWNRWEAKFRKQEIMKVRNDIDNGFMETEQIYIPELRGTHEKPKKSFMQSINYYLTQLLP